MGGAINRKVVAASSRAELVCSSDNGVGHISEVKLRRARLVLGLVTFGGSTVPVSIQATHAYSAWQPSVGIEMSTGGDFGHH